MRDHLLIYNDIPSLYEFTILSHGHNKHFLETKKSWLIKRDRLVLNKNISSAKLFNFKIIRT